MTTAVRVLGLDPGLVRTGWGMVLAEGNRLRGIAAGTVVTDDGLPMAERLRQLHDGLAAVIREQRPDTAAVEETFLNVNPASTLKLGQARGVVLLAPALAGLTVAEYAATRVKKAVVGAGHADKAQVAAMVRRLLPELGTLSGSDAADALAVAICHAHHARSLARWGAAGPGAGAGITGGAA